MIYRVLTASESEEERIAANILVRSPNIIVNASVFYRPTVLGICLFYGKIKMTTILMMITMSASEKKSPPKAIAAVLLRNAKKKDEMRKNMQP